MPGIEDFYTDIRVIGKAIIENVPNAQGTFLTYDTTTKEFGQRTGAQIISDLSLMTTNTDQYVDSIKIFRGGNTYNTAPLRLDGNGDANTIFPTLSFHQPGRYAATLSYRGDGFHFMNADADGYNNIYANGLIKAGSDNTKVLLGGGADKLISDFALASQLGNYLPLSGGTLTGGGLIASNGNIFVQQTEVGGNATGLFWQDIPNSQFISGIGAYTENGNFYWNYLGWGAYPWSTGTSLAVGDNIFTYKDNRVWHEGILEDYHQYGLGKISVPILTDLDTYSAAFTGFYRIDLSQNAPYNYGTTIKVMRTASEGTEIAVSVWGEGLAFRGYVGGSYGTWNHVWHTGNFNPDTKVNVLENAKAIGFSSGAYPTDNGSEYPYIYHANSGSNTPFVPLATQGFVNTNLSNYVTIHTPQTIIARKVITGGTGDHFSQSALEIMGNSFVPGISFHQPGIIASQIRMDNSGTICIINGDGGTYENFRAKGIIGDSFSSSVDGNSSQWFRAYNNGLVNRGAIFQSNVDANNLGNQQSAIVSIELGNGTGNTNFPVNNTYGTFMKMSAQSFTSEFFHQNGGELWHRNWYFGGSPSDYPFRKIYDNINLPNPATESWTYDKFIYAGDSTTKSLGFTAGNQNEAPYIYTNTGYFIYLGTQYWVNQNFIPKTHPANSITQNYLDGWFSYWGYGDVRYLRPENIEPKKLQFGFTSWNNDAGAASIWGDFLHFGGYTDSSGGNQNLIVFKKNGFGLRQYQGTWQSPTAYQSYVDYWNTGHFTQADIDHWNGLVNYVLPQATDNFLGGIRLFTNLANNIAPQLATTVIDRSYQVQLNNEGKALVNVPWIDTIYVHPTTSGNKHIPSGGSSNQILKWLSDGTAQWSSDYMDVSNSQNVDGIKTFFSSPRVPTASQSDDAVNLGQVEELIAASDIIYSDVFAGQNFDLDQHNYPKITTISCKSADDLRIEGMQTGMTVKVKNTQPIGVGILINGGNWNLNINPNSWLELFLDQDGDMILTDLTGCYIL